MNMVGMSCTDAQREELGIHMRLNGRLTKLSKMDGTPAQYDLQSLVIILGVYNIPFLQGERYEYNC